MEIIAVVFIVVFLLAELIRVIADDRPHAAPPADYDALVNNQKRWEFV